MCKKSAVANDKIVMLSTFLLLFKDKKKLYQFELIQRTQYEKVVDRLINNINMFIKFKLTMLILFNVNHSKLFYIIYI